MLPAFLRPVSIPGLGIKGGAHVVAIPSVVQSTQLLRVSSDFHYLLAFIHLIRVNVPRARIMIGIEIAQFLCPRCP